jgi:uncharacterized protein (TIGR03083 family)
MAGDPIGHDVGAAYAAGRARVTALLADLPEAAGHRSVPACPGWEVHDVLAHVSGVCVDILDGRIEGAGTDPWVAVQVEARRDVPVADLLHEWNAAAPSVEAMAGDFGETGRQWVFDFAVHEQDMRGALDAPGGRDAASWAVGLEFVLPAFHGTIAQAGLPAVRVITPDREWESPHAPSVETLRVDGFELGRALTGRRSADQVRAFDWSTDPEPYLAAFAFGPFRQRPSALVE